LRKARKLLGIAMARRLAWQRRQDIVLVMIYKQLPICIARSFDLATEGVLQ